MRNSGHGKAAEICMEDEICISHPNPEEQREKDLILECIRSVGSNGGWTSLKAAKVLASWGIGVEVASSPASLPLPASKTQLFLTVSCIPATPLLQPSGISLFLVSMGEREIFLA